MDEEFPWAAQRLRRLEGVLVPDVMTMPADAATDQDVLIRAEIRSIVFLPMAAAEEMVGYLGFDATRRAIHWTDNDASLLRVMGALIAAALQRRAAEETLHQEVKFTNELLNSSGAIFVVLDSAGEIVRFNPAAEAVTGYALAEVMGKSPWDSFATGEDGRMMQREFAQLTAGGSLRTEGYLTTRNGERRQISWSVSTLTNSAGQVEHVIFSGLDVTENRRLEAEVRNISEREQSRLGHDLHDGLGQHLTGMEYMCQVLNQTLALADRPEAQEVQEIATLMRQAISQTRDLARGLSPVVVQSKGLPVALDDLASSVSKRLCIQCELTVSPGLNQIPEETAIHLYRIAQEAINNAIKHGKAKHV